MKLISSLTWIFSKTETDIFRVYTAIQGVMYGKLQVLLGKVSSYYGADNTYIYLVRERKYVSL